MKKLLGLALVAMFATSAFAADFSFKNFKFYGEGAIIGATYENVGLPASNNGRTAGYFTLGTMFDVYENITASLAFGYEYLWGDSGLRGTSIDSTAPNEGYLNQLRVVEANVNFSNLFDIKGLSAKIGRQYYGDEDSTVMYLGIRRNQPLVVRPAAWGLPVDDISAITSADGAAVYYENGNIKANVMYGILENRANMNQANYRIIGGDFKYLGLFDMLDLQAYIYNIYNTNNLTIVGAKPTFKYEGLKASVEFAKEFNGKNVFDENQFSTNLIKADVAYTIENISLTPRAMYMVVGGDGKFFPGRFGNYRPGLIVGYNSMYDFEDNQIINVGVDYVWKKATLKLDWFNFDSRDGKELTKNGEKFGDEIDFVVNYAYTENVDVFLGVGHLFGNSKNRNPNYDSSTLQAGVTYKFK